MDIARPMLGAIFRERTAFSYKNASGSIKIMHKMRALYLDTTPVGKAKSRCTLTYLPKYSHVLAVPWLGKNARLEVYAFNGKDSTGQRTRNHLHAFVSPLDDILYITMIPAPATPYNYEDIQDELLQYTGYPSTLLPNANYWVTKKPRPHAAPVEEPEEPEQPDEEPVEEQPVEEPTEEPTQPAQTITAPFLDGKGIATIRVGGVGEVLSVHAQHSLLLPGATELQVESMERGPDTEAGPSFVMTFVKPTNLIVMAVGAIVQEPSGRPVEMMVTLTDTKRIDYVADSSPDETPAEEPTEPVTPPTPPPVTEPETAPVEIRAPLQGRVGEMVFLVDVPQYTVLGAKLNLDGKVSDLKVADQTKEEVADGIVLYPQFAVDALVAEGKAAIQVTRGVLAYAEASIVLQDGTSLYAASDVTPYTGGETGVNEVEVALDEMSTVLIRYTTKAIIDCTVTHEKYGVVTLPAENPQVQAGPSDLTLGAQFGPRDYIAGADLSLVTDLGGTPQSVKGIFTVTSGETLELMNAEFSQG